jgi:hypothetical protein
MTATGAARLDHLAQNIARPDLHRFDNPRESPFCAFNPGDISRVILCCKIFLRGNEVWARADRVMIETARAR